jgi:hypothetical protein
MERSTDDDVAEPSPKMFTTKKAPVPHGAFLFA